MQTLDTPSGPYKLVYNIKLFDLTTEKVVDNGTYTLSEWKTHLVAKLAMSGLKRQLFFDGEKTLLTSPSNSAFCYEGLTFGMMPLPLYMPFRFINAPIYFPLANYQESIQRLDLSGIPPEIAKQLRQPDGSNFSIKTGLTQKGDTYLPATLTFNADSSKLVVGPAVARFNEFSYEAPVNLVGVKIPSRIAVKVYEEVPGELRRKETRRFELSLAKCTGDPKAITKSTADDFLTAGMTISYNGVTKPSGTIVYNRSEGTFDHQLARMQSLPTGRGGEATVQQTPSLAVPLTLIIAFAAVSISFLCLAFCPLDR